MAKCRDAGGQFDPAGEVLTDINVETIGPDCPQWWDTITIRDENGTEVDVIRVESSGDAEPYDEAIRAAGHADYRWIEGV